MRKFTIYGLDEGQRLLATEEIRAADVASARLMAAERLKDFPRIELWEGSVCISRKSRPKDRD